MKKDSSIQEKLNIGTLTFITVRTVTAEDIYKIVSSLMTSSGRWHEVYLIAVPAEDGSRGIRSRSRYSETVRVDVATCCRRDE